MKATIKTNHGAISISLQGARKQMASYLIANLLRTPTVPQVEMYLEDGEITAESGVDVWGALIITQVFLAIRYTFDPEEQSTPNGQNTQALSHFAVQLETIAEASPSANLITIPKITPTEHKVELETVETPLASPEEIGSFLLGYNEEEKRFISDFKRVLTESNNTSSFRIVTANIGKLDAVVPADLAHIVVSKDSIKVETFELNFNGQKLPLAMSNDISYALS